MKMTGIASGRFGLTAVLVALFVAGCGSNGANKTGGLPTGTG